MAVMLCKLAFERCVADDPHKILLAIREIVCRAFHLLPNQPADGECPFISVASRRSANKRDQSSIPRKRPFGPTLKSKALPSLILSTSYGRTLSRFTNDL